MFARRRTEDPIDNDSQSLDDDIAERLLSLELAAEDAPLGYGGVVSLFSSATADYQPGDRDAAITKITDQLTASLNKERANVRPLIPVKVAAIAAGAVLSMSGVAAAATTGHLPAPVQTFVSDTASHVGVDLPSTKTPAAPSTDAHPSAELCHEAQQVEGAKGCSEIAHEYAPGQAKKPEVTSTTTTAVPGKDDDIKPESEVEHEHPDDPNKNSESHSSANESEHGNSSSHSGKSDDSTTTTTTARSSNSGKSSGKQHDD